MADAEKLPETPPEVLFQTCEYEFVPTAAEIQSITPLDADPARFKAIMEGYTYRPAARTARKETMEE